MITNIYIDAAIWLNGDIMFNKKGMFIGGYIAALLVGIVIGVIIIAILYYFGYFDLSAVLPQAASVNASA